MSSKKHMLPPNDMDSEEGSVQHHSDQEEESGEEENEFIVEKILKKRKKGSKVEYYLKWKGFPESENSWEPVENLGCPDLIAQFEEQEKKKQQQQPSTPKSEKKPHSKSEEPAQPRHHDTPSPKKQKKTEPATDVSGFERGLLPDKIIGATDTGGELTFLLKWKHNDNADLIPARVANQKCPQVVIQFYESRLTWKSNKNEDEY